MTVSPAKPTQKKLKVNKKMMARPSKLKIKPEVDTNRQITPVKAISPEKCSPPQVTLSPSRPHLTLKKLVEDIADKKQLQPSQDGQAEKRAFLLTLNKAAFWKHIKNVFPKAYAASALNMEFSVGDSKANQGQNPTQQLVEADLVDLILRRIRSTLDYFPEEPTS